MVTIRSNQELESKAHIPVILDSQGDPEMERRRLLAKDGEHLFALGELGEGDLNHLEAGEEYSICSNLEFSPRPTP